MSAPTRVGFLIDLKPLFSGKSEKILKLTLDSFQLAFDEALEDGVIDRPVEIIVEETDGLPTGSVHAVVNGWKSLVAKGAVAIIGPQASENMIALREYVETEGRVPTLVWPGTDRQYGEWIFGLTNGSLSEEPYLMANYLAHQGITKVAVIYEDAHIGREYLSFFREACKYEKIRIVHQEEISQIQEDLSGPVRELKAAGAEGIAYLGFGHPAVRVNAELKKIGWDPHRIMNTAFLTAPFTAHGMKALKGWAGIDQYDEENEIGQSVINRFEKRYGFRPANFFVPLCHDTANIIAYAISRGHPISPSGLKQGLERIKMLPAATGGAGTLISFAPYVRRAWLGPNYLVVRKATTDEDVTVFGDMKTQLVHRYKARSREERRGK